MSNGFVPETGFTQGAAGAANVYDTSPSGLGLSPAYLSQGASASATASLSSSVLTGAVNSGGTLSQGSGFTSVKTGTGNYTVTFTVAFAISPTVIVTPFGLANIVAILGSISTTAFTVTTTAGATNTVTDSGFNFLATATQ